MNDIKSIGIIGSGKMGSDIFNYLSDFNFELIWYTIEDIAMLQKTFHKKINRQLKHGIISKEIFDFKFKYKITDKFQALSNCDLVIESVIEELDVKVEIFRRLDEIVKPSCILVSNSSSILPSELSESVQRKNRVLGMHFFYPIAFKNIVEVISSEYTDEISIEKTKLFLDDINRYYFQQNEDCAFILNRFLLQLQIIALELKKEFDLGYQQFDDIAKELIPDFGLFEIMDHVGHNTMYNAIMNYSRMDKDKKKYEAILIELRKFTVSEENTTHLFYELETEQKIISVLTKLEIIEKLKETANKYLSYYTEQSQSNIFNLKKGLEEFCGIKL